MAVLAGGCFWCLEAVFRELNGVLKVEPGYCGGSHDTANYEQVCTGATDHAEAVRIQYDQNQIRYDELLRIFFTIAHDPTQKDRQGNDRGRQYRSAIFYASDEQKTAAHAAMETLTRDRVFKEPIVTEVVSLMPFYLAEAYHHNYAACHVSQPYIAHISAPKVEKLRRNFAAMLRIDPLP
ncbi:MAG TPA: peptide-methionine (S)-S-oxide reductase MsrA [Acidiferrobacter sp.]|nr:peptide-methionine (S)-S-oxide reductase MsrA [Acidiferrobacter sp.]